ncbi:MAG TPA: hypothetical protein VJ183_17725 [Chloroflexia bacterium]|nr:hypothetical protein [Chloroflexia bacterium]
MVIQKSRRRSGPLYRRCGSEVISYVPEVVTWELRLAGRHFTLLRIVQKAVYIIDQGGVRREKLSLRLRFGHNRG